MAAAKTQTSQGIVLQGYCNSVLLQPKVDFTGFTNLLAFQNDINSGLLTAQGHASNYLNVIQPEIITNLSNINNYYQLMKAIPVACPAGSSVDAWLNALTAIKTQADTYQTASLGIVTDLSTLNTNLGTDTGAFSSTVSKLNAAVNGDNGVLHDISDEISSVDQKIAACIAGTALSALAIVGGGLMIAVGGIAGFVTAGASTPLVLGGVAVLALGVGGEVASAVMLNGFYNQKAGLLQQKSKLTSEVNLAMGVSSAYDQLANQAKSAMDASTQMKNAWSSMASDLGNMSTDLQNGITNPDVLRTLFLTAAQNLVPTIMTDISTIKAQMAGVTVSQSGSTDLGTYIQSIAQQSSMAKAA